MRHDVLSENIRMMAKVSMVMIASGRNLMACHLIYIHVYAEIRDRKHFRFVMAL